MNQKIEFPIKKIGKKIRVNFNKSIYPLSSVKVLLDDRDVIREDENYWSLEVDNLSVEDVMQSYNYLIYLNRSK